MSVLKLKTNFLNKRAVVVLRATLEKSGCRLISSFISKYAMRLSIRLRKISRF